MIYGIGVDLVNIERMDKVIRRWGDRFVKRVFTRLERETCLARAYPPSAFSLRFAAKEAVLKALGVGMFSGVALTDIAICRDPSGRPRVELAGDSGTRIHISISHTDTVAVATAVAEGQDP